MRGLRSRSVIAVVRTPYCAITVRSTSPSLFVHHGSTVLGIISRCIPSASPDLAADAGGAGRPEVLFANKLASSAGLPDACPFFAALPVGLLACWLDERMHGLLFVPVLCCAVLCWLVVFFCWLG